MCGAPFCVRAWYYGVMDIALHYTEQGSGQPLVLLHGNNEDSSYFVHQIEHLSRGFRVIALDTRGHGRSPRGRAPFTLGQFASDLAAFMDERGIDAAHLLGFSDGGNIALLFALAHPQRVKSLVLNGANLYPEGIVEEVRLEDRRALARAVAANDVRSQEMLRLMIDEPHIDPADLARLNMPTLVVAGTNDMIADEHTRLIARSVTGAKLSIVEGSHFVAAENPAAFNAVLDGFYQGFC